jgi:hypothetical protein
VAEYLHSSTSVLHKRWAELEDEHHELAVAIDAARARRADLAPMRERQARLLLDINSLVAEIRDAPARTLEDFCALLDVAFEHEVDLGCDIAFYGPADFPMICRLIRFLRHQVPGFEFNSLRRWLSSGQLEELMGGATRLEAAGYDAAPAEPSAFLTAIHDSARRRG